MTQAENENTPDAPWPVELRLRKNGRYLLIAFDDGTEFDLSAEYLRVESPSAELRGHGPRENKKIIGGKKNVAITALDPVGNYAVRPAFDDGHHTGLYTWAYLHELGREQQTRWAAYLDALAEAGLSRD